VFDPTLRIVDRAGRTIAREGDVVMRSCVGGIDEVRGRRLPRSPFPERGMATLELDVCGHDGTPPRRYRIELRGPDDTEQVVRSQGEQCETQRIRVRAGVQRMRVDPRDRTFETAYRFVGLRRGTVERREIALQRFVPGMGTGTADVQVCDIDQEEPVEIPAVLTFTPIGDNGPVGQPPIHVENACRGTLVTVRAGNWTVTYSSPGYQSQSDEMQVSPRSDGDSGADLDPLPPVVPSPSASPGDSAAPSPGSPTAPTAEWGPMAVVHDPGREALDAGYGPGRLAIGERCVVLRGPSGPGTTLIWRDGQARWDGVGSHPLP
jgi:hypothetical protein